MVSLGLSLGLSNRATASGSTTQAPKEIKRQDSHTRVIAKVGGKRDGRKGGKGKER